LINLIFVDQHEAANMVFDPSEVCSDLKREFGVILSQSNYERNFIPWELVPFFMTSKQYERLYQQVTA